MKVTRQGFVAGAAATFATINVIAKAEAAAEFDFKYGVDVPAEHPIHVQAAAAFGRIKAATNGRVQVKTFPTSQLGSDPNMLSQLRTGALEILALPGAFLNELVPVASIENLAYAFATRDAVFKAMDGDLGAVIRDDIRSKGMVVFDKIWENGYREITTSTKPIKHVNDLAGLKIRVSPGKIRIDTFKSLGASPTPISLSELYTSLQTHVVDAQENPLILIEQQKFYEVQKYVSLSNHIWSGYWTLVNQDAWKRLPADIQKIFNREMNSAAVLARNMSSVLNLSIADKLRRRGMTFNEVDVASFKAKLVSNGYYERWKKEFGDKAWTALEKYANKLG
ncbi:MAG: TRAP transporter substrate-binding protein [Candidatus Eremiobacteraeota bacterium]|nr:TRAP transporter substrate-binding protein [Candidatus Eremiobacteraeota bacterium]